jgi:putative transposase
MTRRRIVEAGRTTGDDRRTTRRHYLFTPDEAGKMEQIFWYCLGLAAQENDVSIHAATLCSTHPHTVVTDNEGKKPDFRKRFHRLLALCTKDFRGWPEEVFNKSQGGEHELLTPKALVRHIAYVIANPVDGYAVRYAKDWPGAKTLPQDIGRRVIRVPRPDFYLDSTNPQWPTYVEFKLEMPQMLIDHYGSLEKAQEAIAAEVKKLERAALQRAKREGRPFMGARRVLRTKHTKRSSSPEELGSRNPQFAAAGDAEAAAAAIRKIRAFNADYDEALARWTAGDRDVVFPYGTWWMRVHHGVRCHPPP